MNNEGKLRKFDIVIDILFGIATIILAGKGTLSMLEPAITGLIVCVTAIFFLKKKN
ncbi:hypothetical protein [uncultured Leptotrichia sp.]|uniref:hypothetical protein n=1 Tax=uncultured Leptotrichia sp. TaxID=159271 RepID=UPI0025D4EBE4|nr:hypothetical protein [uncultured Leptotrichia sp.]